MKERPILFSGPMVRAILEGRKTVTRRVMKPQPTVCNRPGLDPGHWWPSRAHQHMLHVENELQNGEGGWEGLAEHACPYGETGDRLWVRETWIPDPEDDGSWGYMQWSGCKGSPLTDIPKRFQKPEHCIHRATWSGSDLLWRPSIHMPRWACRILLEITAVRVERLQDISGDQAEAEGVDSSMCRQFLETSPSRHECNEAVIHGFAGLWASINGDDSWRANPWVWVVEFKRVEQGE